MTTIEVIVMAIGSVAASVAAWAWMIRRERREYEEQARERALTFAVEIARLRCNAAPTPENEARFDEACAAVGRYLDERDRR